MKKLLLAVPFIFSSALLAKSISTPATVPVVVDSNIGKRVCYYQDQAYSEGALLQVGDLYMICKAANKFETNGQLKWIQLETEQKKAPE